VWLSRVKRGPGPCVTSQDIVTLTPDM
jgi:hypothetical protein